MNPVLGFGRDNPKRKLAGATPRRFWFAKLRRSRFRLVKTGRNGAVLRAGSVSDGLTHLSELPQERLGCRSAVNLWKPRILTTSQLYLHRFDLPDGVAILANAPIRGEPTHPGDIQDRLS